MKFSISLLLFFSMLPFPIITHGQGVVINIIYTGGVAGELEPCGCSPKTDFGGIARRAGYIAENREGLSPYVLIDAGNFAAEDTPQGRLKTEAMLKAFRTMKYDAIALLETEKKLPPDLLSSLVKEDNILATYDIPKHRPSLSIRRDNIHVHVSVDQEDYQEGKLNILLTNRPVSEIKSLKGWDIIILSSGVILEEPLRVDGAIIVSGYPRGERLGILTLQIDKKKGILDSKHRWQSLGKKIKEDINVRKVLDEYNVKVARLLEEDYRPPKDSYYLGILKCGKCHQPFVESWEKTQHAHAFPTLELVGKTKDPECVACHTVGFGKKGGFYSIETTPGLANVQCEACHVKGRDHLSDFSIPMEPVTRVVCLRCHTERQSPDFDYLIYLEKIRHW